MNISRRPARVFAMQVLYVMEINGGTPGEALAPVLASQEVSKEMQAFGMKLVDLVLENRKEYEITLQTLSTGWDLDRMAVLDRIIIWLGFAELTHVADVPARVVLQEAVQIASKYSTEQSTIFVNGILDRFARDQKMLGDINND